jgi:alanyl-tRNA synthetase
MTGNEIRTSFLEYFEERTHRVVESSSLIPQDDPTLLFTNAGMNQFKDIFLGRKTPDFRRAASTQKCIRAGGKHNDLEDVGKDGTHHTFFEMLGNWSFGDYYKAEAIEWAWDYLTRVIGLPADDLRATVHTSDDEAEELWLKISGMPIEHVSRHGDKDNFWEMADVGPCGPCSEIHLDLGTDRGCRRDDCGPNCTHCDDVHDARFIELWNLVFMQYYRDEKGELSPLPETHVDTGMGFERLVSVVQGTASNYDTDVFSPIMRVLESLSGETFVPGLDPEGAPFRIIADHIRSLTFAIADGGFPSNAGRGYVLRRILRRASRAGRQLGLMDPFLHELSATVIDSMGDSFPELLVRREHVAEVIRREEEQFGRTLHRGIDQFEDIAATLEGKGEKQISGADMFRLYDTFGVLVDLTALMAEEKGLAADMDGYEVAMEEQRQRSRAAGKFTQSGVEFAPDLKTEFVGYDTLSTEGQVIGVAEWTDQPNGAAIVLDQTPFYAESGGQVGDIGTLAGEGFEFEVIDTQKYGDAVVHYGTVTSGEATDGMPVHANVTDERRERTIRNHSATHLLQAALQEVLGDQVHQAGSSVDADRLRFDFTFGRGVESEELEQVERIANANIRENMSVTTTFQSIDEARAAGAMALFGEKYGDIVRVVDMGSASKELCGGTHVRATGQIGYVRITSEGGIAAGTRRIEAVTGIAAEELARTESQRLERLGSTLRSVPEEVESRVAALGDRVKELERDLERTRKMMSTTDVDAWLRDAGEIAGSKVLVQQVDVADSKDFRALGDQLREKLGSGVGVLASPSDGKLSVMVLVSDDLVSRGVKAGDIIRDVGALVDAKGGGRPHMAQAGGGDASKLPDLLAKAPGMIAESLQS